MGKGFLSGIIWGGVSGIAFLSILSLYNPLSEERRAALAEAEDAMAKEAEGQEGAPQSSELAPVEGGASDVDLAASDRIGTESAEATETVATPVTEDDAEPVTAETEPKVAAASQEDDTDRVEPATQPEVATAAPETAPEVDAPAQVTEAAEAEIAPVEAEPDAQLDVAAIGAGPDASEAKAPAQVSGTAETATSDAAGRENPQPITTAETLDAQPTVITPEAPGPSPDVLADAPEGGQVSEPADVAAAPVPSVEGAAVAAAPTALNTGVADAAPEAPAQTAQPDLDVTVETVELTPPAPQVASPSLPDQPSPTVTRLASPIALGGAPSASAAPEAQTRPATRVAKTPEPEVAGPSEEVPEITLAENDAGGVVVNRLPRIGAEPAAEPEIPAEEAPEAAEPADPESTAPNLEKPVDALRQFAAAPVAEADGDKIGVILIDAGEGGMSAAALQDLSLTFSVAIDPSALDAGERAAAFRAAGIEVLALINDLPLTATPADVAVAMEGYLNVLPEAIGVLDPLDARLQADRAMLSSVLNAISGSGHALVTYDRGLNNAQRQADRSGVPNATIFRVLDSEDENAPRITRYLDRAAFNAARDGSVVVIGRTRPETVEALMAWNTDARGAELTMVPISQVMLDGE